MRRALAPYRWQPLTPLASDVDVSGTNSIVSSLKVGFTHVQNETNNSTTKGYLATAAVLENQHLFGFGQSIDPQVRITNKVLSGNVVTLTASGPLGGWLTGQSVVVAGLGSPYDGTFTLTAKTSGSTSSTFTYAKTASNAGPTAVTAKTALVYNWTGLDQKFGYPTRSTGIMPNADECVVTLLSSPVWMRLATNSDIDPMGNVAAGTEDATSSAKFPPPHSSNMQDYANFVGLFAARYPHVTHYHVWNEFKELYITTPAAGSALVQAGWAEPAGPAGGGRYWYEGYTHMFNLIWTAVKAQVTADSIARDVSGPYPVHNTLSWEYPSQWADDAFPDLLMGAWGYADKGTLAIYKYFIRYCTGCDYFNTDIRNNAKDWEADDYAAFLPSPNQDTPTPKPSSKWVAYTGVSGSGPPHSGSNGRYWLEGDTLGPWNGFAKMAALRQWLIDLAAYDGDGVGVYRRAAANAATLANKIWYSEWYAHPYQSQRQINPVTAGFYPELPAGHPEKAAVVAWGLIEAVKARVTGLLIWKPEGDATAKPVKNPDGDSYWSNPLALLAGRIDLGATDAGLPSLTKPIFDAVVAQFGAGKQLKVTTVNNPLVNAMATATHIFIVSRSSSYLPLVVDAHAVVLNPFEARLIVR